MMGKYGQVQSGAIRGLISKQKEQSRQTRCQKWLCGGRLSSGTVFGDLKSSRVHLVKMQVGGELQHCAVQVLRCWRCTLPRESREESSTARSSHSAWSWCRHQSHPSPCQASLRCPSNKRCAILPNPRSRRGTCKVGFSSGHTWKRTLVGGRVRSGSGSGDDRSEYTQVLKGGGTGEEGLHWLGGPVNVQHHLRTSHECLRVITAAHEKSAGRFDDHAQRVVELAAARKGTSSPPLRPFPKFTKGRRD